MHPEKTLQKLEYDKIIAQLAKRTSFACSREQALALRPLEDQAAALEALAETTEGRDILRLYPTFSLGALRDYREHLRFIEVGGTLDAAALLQIADCCRAARATRDFFTSIKGSLPLTCALGRSLSVLRTIESAVEKAIEDDGSISDNASEKLYHLRKKLKTSADRIRDRLDNLIKNPDTAKYLQEPIVTMREGRFVVPVRQEYRSQIAGIIHDVSASGASVFVEPMAVLELNNDIQRIYREEEDEIAAILNGLTMVVAGFAEELTANLSLLTSLDFIMAKARLSADMDAIAPKLNDKSVISLKAARHPLIPRDKVVPSDLRMDRQTAAMVITGPNTGGKTVTLKTVGLLTEMALSGLHIPAESGDLAFFTSVYADIGDEQSIEQSLSTFSAHMVNIVNILDNADDASLVLLDELGAGTDPTEGAALSMAILDNLKKRGCKILATTHYSELKAFAYNNPGYLNASVEFNVSTLSPTYHLIIGIPGKSNAFEIAARLGLAKWIIEEANEFLNERDAQIADLLANLEEMRQVAQAERDKAEAMTLSLAAKEDLIEQQRLQAEDEAAQLIEQAGIKAQQLVADTIEKSRVILDEMRGKMESEKGAEKVYNESRRQLKTWQQQLEDMQPKRSYKGTPLSEVKVGQSVFVPSFDKAGTVLDVSGGSVAVQIGVLKVMLKLDDLREAMPEDDAKDQAERKYRSGMRIEKAKTLKNEVDLRGMEQAEALEVLDKYLDDAFVAGISKVRIIHGKGTGVLKKTVGEYLTGHRLVKEHYFGGYHEGGVGVTIAELDM